MLEIDGSFGEGGGQILRTGLAVSAVAKRALKIHHIRAARRNPGLQPQHLKAAESLAQITRARVEGLRIGSDTVTFVPQEIIPGEYRFEIGTAGSVTLLLQALLPPLVFSSGRSRVTLVGGTHVPWSPPFHYLKEVFLPTLRLMGIGIEVELSRWGWYPKGGGVADVKIEPNSDVKPLSLTHRGRLKKIRGLSAISNLPGHVAHRQRDYALRRIARDTSATVEIEILQDAPAIGQGSFLFLVAESENGVAGFSSLGRRGKPAEEVAKEAVECLEEYLGSDGCVDPFLADQLVPFMGLAQADFSFTTTRITEHLLTNLWVVQQFFNLNVLTSGKKGGPGRIEFHRSADNAVPFERGAGKC